MNRIRVLASLLVIVLLLVPSAAFARGRSIVYTAMGDSIAVGTGATDSSLGYVGRFATHLSRGHRTVVLNKACYDGMTSGMLLGHLSVPTAPGYAEFNGAAAAAGVISISIGGNDLLQTVAGLTPAYVQSLTPEQRLVVFTQLSEQLNAHSAEFAANWPAIVARIRLLNPTAQVFVNTIYNPFEPGDGLYELIDPYIKGLNGVIVAGSAGGGYEVVDVYARFSSYSNPNKLTVWGLDGAVPLHPTDRGYKFICNLLKDGYAS